MNHLDAKAIRERLNCVVFALVTLEDHTTAPGRAEIAQRAMTALQEIAQLVTADEREEHGQPVAPDIWQMRVSIRQAAAGGG